MMTLKMDFMKKNFLLKKIKLNKHFLLSILSKFLIIITHWEKLLDSDWLRDCGFIRNLRANSVIRGKLQISRAKSVIHSQ